MATRLAEKHLLHIFRTLFNRETLFALRYRESAPQFSPRALVLWCDSCSQKGSKSTHEDKPTSTP